MKAMLRVLRPLVEYDLPQLVLAVDSFDARYLGLLVDVGAADDTYLFSVVSEQRLRDVLTGRIDLRPAPPMFPNSPLPANVARVRAFFGLRG